MHVLPGDRIGFYNINSTGTVAYRLDHNARAFIQSTEPVQVGRDISFETLNYPYVFGVAAYSVNSANGRPPPNRSYRFNLFVYVINTGLSSGVVSSSDCGVKGPRFESHRGRLCLSRRLLRFTALVGCALLL